MRIAAQTLVTPVLPSTDGQRGAGDATPFRSLLDVSIPADRSGPQATEVTVEAAGTIPPWSPPNPPESDAGPREPVGTEDLSPALEVIPSPVSPLEPSPEPQRVVVAEMDLGSVGARSDATGWDMLQAQLAAVSLSPSRSLLDPRFASGADHESFAGSTAAFAELGVFGRFRATATPTLSQSLALPAGSNDVAFAAMATIDSFYRDAVLLTKVSDRRSVSAASVVTPAVNLASPETPGSTPGTPEMASGGPPALSFLSSASEAAASMSDTQRRAQPAARPDKPHAIRPEQIVLGHGSEGLRLIARAASISSIVAILRRAVGLARAEGVSLESATVNGQAMTPKQIEDRITPWP